jgi:hypothetical protein
MLYEHNWIYPLHINHAPTSKSFDLIERVRLGVEVARQMGFKKAFIVENDDWYSPDHFQPFEEDFVGYKDTIYYHIRNKTWEVTKHAGHSSLFSTAFKISAMDNFQWPKPNYVFLDIEIWKYAKRFKTLLKSGNPNIGIKHGIGLCGGMGHSQTFPFKDPEMNWLKAKVDPISFELYKGLGQ